MGKVAALMVVMAVLANASLSAAQATCHQSYAQPVAGSAPEPDAFDCPDFTRILAEQAMGQGPHCVVKQIPKYYKYNAFGSVTVLPVYDRADSTDSHVDGDGIYENGENYPGSGSYAQWDLIENTPLTLSDNNTLMMNRRNGDNGHVSVGAGYGMESTCRNRNQSPDTINNAITGVLGSGTGGNSRSPTLSTLTEYYVADNWCSNPAPGHPCFLCCLADLADSERFDDQNEREAECNRRCGTTFGGYGSGYWAEVVNEEAKRRARLRAKGQPIYSDRDLDRRERKKDDKAILACGSCLFNCADIELVIAIGLRIIACSFIVRQADCSHMACSCITIVPSIGIGIGGAATAGIAKGSMCPVDGFNSLSLSAGISAGTLGGGIEVGAANNDGEADPYAKGSGSVGPVTGGGSISGSGGASGEVGVGAAFKVTAGAGITLCTCSAIGTP